MLIHKYALTTVQACVQTSCAMHACVHVRLFSTNRAFGQMPKVEIS